MRVILDPEARLELVEAVEWLSERSTARAMAFRTAYAKVVQRIAEHPEQFPQVEPGVYRALVRRFRYSVLFALRRITRWCWLSCINTDDLGTGGIGCGSGRAVLLRSTCSTWATSRGMDQ